MRSLETKAAGFWTEPNRPDPATVDLDALLEEIATPKDGRIYKVMLAFDAGATIEQVYDATAIDPWFLAEIAGIGALGAQIRDADELTEDLLRDAKSNGFSDRQIAALRDDVADENAVRARRHELGVRPVYKLSLIHI